MATKADVVRIARQAVAQRKLGDATWEHNGVVFDLVTGGYCARFVRQCHDAALGQGEWVWPYKSPTAWDMEVVLRAAGLNTNNPQAGDIVCVNGSGGRPGHVAIFIGDGLIAENTSSGAHGDPLSPGTKISPLSVVADRITGYYACLPPAAPSGYAPGAITVEVEGAGQCEGWFTDHSIVGVASIARVMGYRVEDRVPTERRVVLRKQA
jgi:hypothetical protein